MIGQNMSFSTGRAHVQSHVDGPQHCPNADVQQWFYGMHSSHAVVAWLPDVMLFP